MTLLKDDKLSKAKLKKLTEMARDQPCWLKLPHICDGGGETTVYAHYRDQSLGFALSQKGLLGCPVCAPCHDAVDGRSHMLERDWVRRIHLEQAVRYWWRELKGKVWDTL
jgi:hypothetical protein